MFVVNKLNDLLRENFAIKKSWLLFGVATDHGQEGNKWWEGTKGRKRDAGESRQGVGEEEGTLGQVNEEGWQHGFSLWIKDHHNKQTDTPSLSVDQMNHPL